MAGITGSFYPATSANAQPANEKHVADPTEVSLADAQFYTKQVKPILVEYCFECHGADPSEIRGGLTLTSRAAIETGGDSGPAVDTENRVESLLLQAIRYEDYEMPPDGELDAEKIAILTQWVEHGTRIPKSEEIEINGEGHAVPEVNDETKKWWSFQPVQRPEVPAVQRTDWPTNPIDYFILGNLESVSLEPALPATRQQLVRRTYYDLTGLPPTTDQVDSFLTDDSPQAYENLIESLLASPHYGEKWGRHWLDLVRYAETNSFERDAAKPFVWRYRDYVIRSFNSDKPYDQFLVEQLAGDEIENPTVDSIIATGYYRLGQWDDEPADPVQAKYDELDSILATTTQTMLGLTVDCARCHDHKIDPIPQRDYYSLISFFENIRRYGIRNPDTVNDASIRFLSEFVTTDEKTTHKQQLADIEMQMEKVESLVLDDFEPVEHEEFKYPMNRIPLIKKRVGRLLTQDQFKNYQQLTQDLGDLMHDPSGGVKVLAVKERGPKPEQSFIRIRGNANTPGEEVSPGFLSVLSPPKPKLPVPPADADSSGRRLVLANWIASDKNPMTARVMANRLWQYHFGRGIVRSASDFGFQGTPPTHPELLDWLAAEIVDQNWSLKAIHRLIMNSSAYRMSSRFNEAAYEIDPDNDRFWRFDLRRLTAEEVRDSILAVTGELIRNKMYGPSIYPEQPAEVLAGQSRPGAGWPTSSIAEQNRRSVYVHVKRTLPLPILATHDAADTDNTCPVRFITTQPTQALGMLNSQFLNEQARKLATHVAANHHDVAAQVESILYRVTQRKPEPEDIERGVNFIAELISSETMQPQPALEAFCLLALNLNEFVYVD